MFDLVPIDPQIEHAQGSRLHEHARGSRLHERAARARAGRAHGWLGSTGGSGARGGSGAATRGRSPYADSAGIACSNEPCPFEEKSCGLSGGAGSGAAFRLTLPLEGR